MHWGPCDNYGIVLVLSIPGVDTDTEGGGGNLRGAQVLQVTRPSYSGCWSVSVFDFVHIPKLYNIRMHLHQDYVVVEFNCMVQVVYFT